MRYLPKPINDLDLIYAVYARRKPTMNAEDLIVDHARKREVVEHIREVMPDSRIAVFARALGIEAIGLRHAAGFVVAADKVDAGWIAEFEADEEGDSFDAEEAAVNVVAYTISIYAVGSVA